LCSGFGAELRKKKPGKPGRPGKPGKPGKPGRPIIKPGKGKGKGSEESEESGEGYESEESGEESGDCEEECRECKECIESGESGESEESEESGEGSSESCECNIEDIVKEVLAEVSVELAAIKDDLSLAEEQIRNLTSPNVFSCKRMSGFMNESVPIPYTGCDVEAPAGQVDLDTGKFTVQRPGIYRLTFTARMSAMNGQAIRADMFVNDVMVGRSWASIDTSEGDATVYDLEQTSTLDLLYQLEAGDEVYMMLDYVGKMSMIQSSSKYQIFFTGEWIRAAE